MDLARGAYAVRGVMTVDTQEATWMVPPQRAVWMPPKTAHRVRTSGEVHMRTLYIEPAAARRMPRGCEVFEVTPLLRELILRATELPLEYEERGPAGRVMRLLLDELAALPRLPYNLPMPKTAPPGLRGSPGRSALASGARRWRRAARSSASAGCTAGGAGRRGACRAAAKCSRSRRCCAS